MIVHDYDRLKADHSLRDIPCAITIGVFDGIHRGHEQLLSEVISVEGRESIVLAFHENPKIVLGKLDRTSRLVTNRQKVQILSEYGIDHLVLIDFSSDFSKLQGEDFIESLVSLFNVEKLVVGRNFRCGKDASFTAADIHDFLSKSSIEVVILDQVMEKSVEISSTLIRNLISEGDLHEVEGLLGRKYSLDLTGVPVHHGIDTTVIETQDINQLLPPPGAYDVIMSLCDGHSIPLVMNNDGNRLLFPHIGQCLPEQIERIDFV